MMNYKEVRILSDEFKDSLIGIGSFINNPKDTALKEIAKHCLRQLSEHPSLPQDKESWEEENDNLYHLLWMLIDYVRDFRDKTDINYLYHHTNWTDQEKATLKQILGDQDSTILMDDAEWAAFYEKRHNRKLPTV